MSRKRIYELAKDWQFSTKDLLTRLRELGIEGKKSQSVLTSEEEEQLKKSLGLAPEPSPHPEPSEVVVLERVVPEREEDSEQVVTVKETVVESRVRAGVIRRRITRVEVGREPKPEGETKGKVEEPPSEIAQPFEAPMAFQLLPEEEAHPVPGLLPVLEPSPEIEPQKEEQVPVEERVEPQPPIPQEVKAPAEEGTLKPGLPEASPAAEARLESPAEAIRPPRILGRIDLGKVGGAPVSEPWVEQEQPGGEGAAEGEVEARPWEEEKKPKKRKTIRRPEVIEVGERGERGARVGRKKRVGGKEGKKPEVTVPRASKRVVRVSEVITVGDLAKAMGVKAGEVIKKLMDLGMMATINEVIDAETAAVVAAEFDHKVENVAFDVEMALEKDREEGEEVVEVRPPVVTIMGHVDHGKTSLLDAIRKSNVTAQEVGGITQHIGAYSVGVDGRSITFLDTPGHEAFTAMRARGARVTDLVVLVVAADDGVMPQTVEAINHARAAGVPLIVAINKVDKPQADVERVKRELMEYGLVPEEWGGDTIMVPVSAKTGQGLSGLMEMILLQAEVMELKAQYGRLARGTIIEAKLDRGRGPVATVLVQEGVLQVGDPFVCGVQYGRVRAMMDSWGQRVEKATPSMPVEILGLSGVPEAGDLFVVMRDEAKARQVAEYRRARQRETELARTGKTSLEDLYQQIQTGEVKELKVIVKADVHGSVEAVVDVLRRLSTEEVKINILHASVGGVSESDVLLASASGGLIIGFNVRPEAKAAQLAEREGVEIRLYSIIYNLIDDVRAALEGMLEPTFRERVLGQAEVRQTFSISGVGVVAGCLVTEGKLTRGAQARLIRDHVVVYAGKIRSLRRFKEDVREVAAGYECGVGLENFQDVKPGDLIEAFELEEVARRLEMRPQEVERRV